MNFCNSSNPWRTVALLRNHNKSGICKDGGNSCFGTMRLLYHAEVSLEIERVFEFRRMLVTTAHMKISLSLIFVCGLK